MGDACFTTFLVDDDPAVLRSIARLLSAAGYRTKTFFIPAEIFNRALIPPFRVVQLSTSRIQELDGLWCSAGLDQERV